MATDFWLKIGNLAGKMVVKQQAWAVRLGGSNREVAQGKRSNLTQKERVKPVHICSLI